MAEKCKERHIQQRLTAYGLDLLSGESAGAVARHILKCQDCADELQSVMELKLALKDRPQELLGQLDQIEKKKAFPFLPPFAIRWASVAMVLLLIIAGAWMYVHRPPPFSKRPGVQVRSALTLIEPKGDVNQPPRVLQWEGMAGVALYTVEIENARTRELLFKSETAQTRVTLPEATARRLQPGAVYVWAVKAFDAAGRWIATAEETFLIR